ncbi:Capsule polysaccharide biosynthesis protein [Rheinheimera sp. A13L]|uniref:capsular polysaccharide export protein, LipB/KpsS family n=1 Tax=Rheinheimera sp. A13L TaxID=506534 RepID=UPI0002124BEE|nr:capsule polysaccharide biosynthesis protein [Rheinheimera sp. A13L]EGM78362.1 Capsule polysaccharide biosynthesis protein [Rheinheimera sp. A13L]
MGQSNAMSIDKSGVLARISPCNSAFYQVQPEQPYVIIFTLNPVEQVPVWLAALADWFQKYGISLVYRHPLQSLPVEFFQQSLGTLLWSGSVPQFEPLKQFMRANGLKYSFIECGFFPQTQHIYFDRQGINVDSSLAANDLNWLPKDVTPILQHKRELFFKDVPTYADQQDYIFVPLQLAQDSNVQLNSRFVNGMQEFIDYIESLYPVETLVFKRHPRDSSSYQLRSARSYWSADCSRALIKGATKVHGINSTVLFEAELYGAETIIEGDCLLTRHADRKTELISALMLWQFDVQQQNFCMEKIAQRSYLALDHYL